MVSRLLAGFCESLESPDCSLDNQQECQTALLWCYYYLAQHHYYLKQYPAALIHVNKAIEHTPTLVEPFMLCARILKHMGDYEQAAAVYYLKLIKTLISRK